MARKAKKKVHPMPPLSAVDKLIYWTLIAALFALDLFLIFGPLILVDIIAFADETVIASVIGPGFLWCFPSFAVVAAVTVVLWDRGYKKRIPIFGRKNFKYGPPAWPRVYPLFMKNKPHVRVSQKEAKRKKKMNTLLAAVVLLSFIPFPWSLFGRTTLQQDGSVARYNVFNVQVKDFSSGEVDRVEFEAYEHHRRRNAFDPWAVRVCLTTESGKEYCFAYIDFRSDTQDHAPGWLSAMLALKSRYRPEIITYSGTENLQKVIRDNELTVEQQAMLYQLFDIS